MKWSFVPVLAFALAAAPVGSQPRREAAPRDVQRLQEDLANLDDQLRALDPQDPQMDKFRRRADDIRDETVYLKVKMNHHMRDGLEGTGVGEDEVADLRRSIRDLRDDLDRAVSREPREIRLPEGTEVVVRLEVPLSSRTARREDRFEATVFRPVRFEGVLAIPAGSRVRGVVREVEPAERPNRSGRLDLEFDALYLDRDRLDLTGRVVSIRQDDRAQAAEKAGIGAILGGVLGGILGGKKGAILGVVVGGTGAVAASRGEDADLPAGAFVTIRLDRPLTIPPRS